MENTQVMQEIDEIIETVGQKDITEVPWGLVMGVYDRAIKEHGQHLVALAAVYEAGLQARKEG